MLERFARSTAPYDFRRSDQGAVAKRMQEVLAKRVSYGYWRV
jgi:hypothetical protein